MMRAFDASVAVFVRGLGNLRGILAKAEAWATSRGVDADALLGARLADDMQDLAAQVHWATYGSRLAIERSFGAASGAATDAPRTFAALRSVVDETIAQLEAVDADALEASLDREVVIAHRGASKTYGVARFLTEFALPNFFFHLTTAYAILRHRGVPLTKGDFMGG